MQQAAVKQEPAPAVALPPVPHIAQELKNQITFSETYTDDVN